MIKLSSLLPITSFFSSLNFSFLPQYTLKKENHISLTQCTIFGLPFNTKSLKTMIFTLTSLYLILLSLKFTLLGLLCQFTPRTLTNFTSDLHWPFLRTCLIWAISNICCIVFLSLKLLVFHSLFYLPLIRSHFL